MNKKSTQKHILGVLFCCFFIGNIGFGQLDSLKIVVANLQDENEKMEVWGKLVDDYGFISKDSALIYCDSIFELAKKTNDKKRIGWSYHKKAQVYFEAEEYEKSIKWSNKAIQYAQKIGYKKLLAQSYNNIGLVEKFRSNHDASIKNYLNAQEYYIMIHDTLGIAKTNFNIAKVFIMIENKKEARSHLFKILNSGISDNRLLSKTYQNLAYTEENDSISAKYLLKAIEKSKTLNDVYIDDFRGLLYNNLGYRTKKKEYRREAIKYYQRALEVAKKRQNRRKLVYISQSIAWTFSTLDNHKQSLFHALEAEKFIDKKEEVYQLFKIYNIIINGYYFTKQYKLAAEYSKLKSELQSEIYQKDLADKLKENVDKYEFEKNQRQIAEQQLQISNSKNTRNAIIFGALILLIAIAAAYQWYLNQQRKKQQAAELALANQQAEAERLKELDLLKTNFFTNISHELRTPLTLILSPLADVMNNVKSNPIQQKLNIIQNNGQKLLNLVNEIMDLSKLEAGKLEINLATVQLSPLVKRLFAAFGSLAEIRKIDYQLNLNIDKQTTVKLDIDKFEKIINNLIGNAIKYNRSYGSITVDVFEKSEQLIVKVSDTGKGIAEEDLPFIFNRFYQSKTKSQDLQGGTGVGLALSKELTDLLNGRLTVESKVGKGSVFMLSLPIEKVEITSSIQVEDTLKISDTFVSVSPFQPIFINGEKPKILVVEDNLEMSKYLVQILSENYQCTTANDGKEALKQLKLYDFDAIISDVMMPNMNGFEFRENVNINQNWRQIPFLMLTARSLEADKIHGLQLGIDDYMTKPFSTNELNARLHNLITNKIERDEFIKAQQTDNQEEKSLSVDQKLLRQAEEIILKNIDNENFKVPDLAKAIGYSSKQLGRIIKQLTGLSTVGFILEIRLQKARTLLEKRIFPTVVEVQYEVGINSTSYFTRKFTERFGKNPREVLNE